MAPFYADNADDMMYNVNTIQGRPPSHHDPITGSGPYAHRSYVRAGVHGGLAGGARRVPLNAGQPNNALRMDTSMWFDAEDRSKYALSSGTITVPYTGEVLRTYHRRLIPATTHRHKDEPSRTRGRAGRGLELQRRAQTRRDPKRTKERIAPQIRGGRAVPYELAENSRSMLGYAARSMKTSIAASGDHEGPLRQSDRAGSFANSMDYRKPFDASVSRFVDPKIQITKKSGTRAPRKPIPAPGSSSSLDRRSLPENVHRAAARRASGARNPTASTRARIRGPADAANVRFGGKTVAATAKVGRATAPMRTSGALMPRAPVVGGVRRAAMAISGAPRSRPGAPLPLLKASGKGSLKFGGKPGSTTGIRGQSASVRGGSSRSTAGAALLIEGPPQSAAVNPKSGLRGTQQAPARQAVRVIECTRVRGPPPTFENAGRRFPVNVIERLGRIGVGSTGQVPAESLSIAADRPATSRGSQEAWMRNAGSGNPGMVAGDTSGGVMRQGAQLGLAEQDKGKGGATRGMKPALMRDAGSGNPGMVAGDTSGGVMRQGAQLGLAEQDKGKGGATRGMKPAMLRDGGSGGYPGMTAGATSGGVMRQGAQLGIQEKQFGKKGAVRGDQQSQASAETLAARQGSSSLGDGSTPLILRTGQSDAPHRLKMHKARGTNDGSTTRGMATRTARAPPAMADGTVGGGASSHMQFIHTQKPKSESRSQTGNTVRVAGPSAAAVAGTAAPRVRAIIMDSSGGRLKTESLMIKPKTQGMEAVRSRTGAHGPGAPKWASVTAPAESRA